MIAYVSSRWDSEGDAFGVNSGKGIATLFCHQVALLARQRPHAMLHAIANTQGVTL